MLKTEHALSVLQDSSKDCKMFYTYNILIICITCYSCLGNQSAPRACLSGTANNLTGQDSDLACQVSSHPIAKVSTITVVSWVNIHSQLQVKHLCIYLILMR